MILKRQPCSRSVLVHDPDAGRWMLFSSPVEVVTARSRREVAGVLEHVADRCASGRWAAGFVSYDAAVAFQCRAKVCPRFPLVWFGIYCQPEEVRVEGRGSSLRPRWRMATSRDAYDKAVEKVRRYISEGDTYQVNYTVRLTARFCSDAWGLFLRMARAQGLGYSAFVSIPGWRICCASPELFFRLDGNRLVSRPMKGTAPRGRWSQEDTALRERLYLSEKDRAENLMIVDMVRNDMGRIAETGSVKVENLYEVERYPTVWQMTSTVSCRTRAGIVDIFNALFPPASVTGAPKIRTTEIIEELEDTPRRLYTGAVGYLAPGRRGQFNVAIRTVLVDTRRRQAEYGVGGGIVWDSRSASEYDECRTKAQVLTASTPRFSLLETLLWTPQDGWRFLDEHLCRLRESADYFGFEVDEKKVRRALEECARRFPPDSRRVRLCVARNGAVRIQHSALVPLPSPFRICLAKEPVDARSAFFYHKTTYRTAYRAARKRCPGVDDVLLWNERGEITETTIANVCVELDGYLWTPPAECGLLAGIFRNTLVREQAVRERVIRVEEIASCRRIILVNSVRGQWDAQFVPCTATDRKTVCRREKETGDAQERP